MKKLLFLGLSLSLLTGCFFGDEPTSYTKLTKDFWLYWWGDSTDQNIVLNTSKNPNGGLGVVGHTVFAVGYNDNFIIAKQHPDKQEEIQARIFNRDTSEGAFLLTNPADTVWLSSEDSIYKKNGKWYHISNGWNPPSNLKPYKGTTYYYIVDISKYQSGNSDSYKVFKFDNEKNFIKKRHELKIPENLTFTILSPALE